MGTFADFTEYAFIALMWLKMFDAGLKEYFGLNALLLIAFVALKAIGVFFDSIILSS
ncbi:MAG: hypothetical protein ACI4M9_03950 [Succinivibrio sp.]